MYRMYLLSKENFEDSLLNEYRNVLRNKDLDDVIWALMLFSMPIVLLSVILSTQLIYVIVIDYDEYINVISQ